MTSRFTIKTGLIAAAATLAVTTAAPAASADQVDDLLAKIPAGQISCAQAESYWTNSADYQQKRSQALAIAPFHRRGGEIRAAISRIDEAVARCNLNNKVGNTGTTQPAPSRPAPSQPAPSQPAQNRPAPANPAPAKPAPQLPVIDLSIPGQPSVTVPFMNVALVKIPDVQKMAEQALAGSPLAQLSSR